MRRSILLCAFLLGACVSVAPPSRSTDVLDQTRSLLDGEADVGDLSAALVELDAVAADCAESASYHALRGELTLRMASAERDAGATSAGLLFEEAAGTLKRAVELDPEPSAPRLLLAQAQYQSNELEAAVDTASELVRQLQDQGVQLEQRLAAHALLANAAGRGYAAKMASGADDPRLLKATRSSLVALEQQGRLDSELLALWSATEQWAGEPAEAVRAYARAAQREPENQEYLNALVDVAAAQAQLPVALAAVELRTDATGLWYQGRLLYLHAGVEREKPLPSDALEALDSAMQCFTDSMRQNPDYRSGCEQWLAMCLGKKGNIAFLADDLPNAEAWLLESTRLCPERIAEDLGQSETTKLGLLRVGDRYMRNFQQAEAFYRSASDLVGNDLDLLNNAAVFARDRGNQLERGGEASAAAEYYERSFATYLRAVQLDPQNVRLCNDCALIAVHHLEREWELSKELLDRAIVEGELMLATSPPTQERELQDLDEALGDAYENLALWHLKHSKNAAAAKAAATTSLDHYPNERRAGALRHLEAAERSLSGG
jgi:tetratricopeptide (TPR) repeat protein